jgi:transcriptional regulatory protein RtcR
MATLAPSGRIRSESVDEEIGRLQRLWGPMGSQENRELQKLLGDRLLDIDRFDQAQLRDVISVCRKARSLSEAGRVLFAASRKRRATTNDADRLRKYLARFDLAWEQIAEGN